MFLDLKIPETRPVSISVSLVWLPLAALPVPLFDVSVAH
jgi:hypothetical protein